MPLTWLDVPRASVCECRALAAHCVRRTGTTTPGPLWAAAAALDTDTLFGGFKIDPVTGAQVKHEAVLVRWASGELALA
jgi:hypothetical protein